MQILLTSAIERCAISLFFCSRRAKNHILPEEPYFATFFYNVLRCSEANICPFFEAVIKNVLKFIGIKEKIVFIKKKEITGESN